MDNIKIKKWTKEQRSEYHKKWREKNKEKLKSYRKKWHEENKEHIQQYLKDNADHIKELQKEYRENHKVERKKMWQDWYEKHPERSPRRRFTEAKSAAKKRKIMWSLSLEEYSQLIAMPCHYCQNKLGEPVKRASGLDRLNSDKGYELINVVSCCYTCNCIKHQFLTPEETKAAVKAVLEMRELANKLPCDT